MDNEPTKPGSAPKPPTKKYTPPVLTHYGTIKDITKSKGGTGQLDGGGTGRDRTAIG
jgi:hypothetical protein